MPNFDFKKAYPEFYLPKAQPSIIEIPPINYLAVRGQGDPNLENGAYKSSINLLYAIAFTLKMSKRSGHEIAGYFDYVVPPLEGLWWQPNAQSTATIDYAHKDSFHFISLIRLPDFVTKADFDWAIATATAKKSQDFLPVEFFTYDEGLCVQCLHLGPYDSEPATIDLMSRHLTANDYTLDIHNPRYHHEIYLSDPRRCAPDKLRTVIRHPIKIAK